MFYSTENAPQIEDEGCGYVYFVRAEGIYPNNDPNWGRYKIGQTQNLKRRMRELKSKQQATFNRLLFAIAVKNHCDLEKDVHQKYYEYRWIENQSSTEWFDLPRSWEESIETLYHNLEQKYYYFLEDAPPTQASYSRSYSSASYSSDGGFGCLLAFGLIILAPIAFFAQNTPEGMQYFDRLRTSVNNTPEGMQYFDTPRTVPIDASASGYGGAYFCRQPATMPDCNPMEISGKTNGGIIPNGSVVKELGWNGSWSRVEFESRQGWVSSRALPN
ncbi:MAG: GIY-YIG nuclease family protein [Cyanobacteriota bacterium]|nr:GIY-YIG nuclease family protein [Cyanobacteriota bacterium]